MYSPLYSWVNSSGFAARLQGQTANEKLQRAVRNLPGLKFTLAGELNAFEALAHQTLILTKEAVEKLESKFKETKQ